MHHHLLFLLLPPRPTRSRPPELCRERQKARVRLVRYQSPSFLPTLRCQFLDRGVAYLPHFLPLLLEVVDRGARR